MLHIRTDADGNQRILTTEELESENAAGEAIIAGLMGGTSVLGILATFAFSILGAAFVFAHIKADIWQAVWALCSIVVMPIVSCAILMKFRWYGLAAMTLATAKFAQYFDFW